MTDIPPNKDNARIAKSLVRQRYFKHYPETGMWEIDGGVKLSFGIDPWLLEGASVADTSKLSAESLALLKSIERKLPMITSASAFAHYGAPHKERNLSLFIMPADLLAANPRLPKRIYANNDIHKPLANALHLLLERGLLGEIKIFNGCFNIRAIRGSRDMSLHSWAIAVDFNAADNPLGMSFADAKAAGLHPFTEAFLKCWRETGWHCGGDWTGRTDRQHYQLAALPA